jgi:hypothetical protein
MARLAAAAMLMLAAVGANSAVSAHAAPAVVDTSPFCRAIAAFVTATGNDAAVPALDSGSVSGLPVLSDFSFVSAHCTPPADINNSGALHPPCRHPLSAHCNPPADGGGGGNDDDQDSGGVSAAAALASYDSGWVASPVSQFTLAEMSVTATGLVCRQSFNATLVTNDDDNASSSSSSPQPRPRLSTFSMSTECKGTVSGTVPSTGDSFSADIAVSVGKTLSTVAAAAGFALPLNETSTYPVYWDGRLMVAVDLSSSSSSSSSLQLSARHASPAAAAATTTTPIIVNPIASTTAIAIIDQDLFDGRPAVVITGATTTNPATKANANNPSVSLQDDAVTASKVVGGMALVVNGPLALVSSSLPAAFRGVLPGAGGMGIGGSTVVATAGELVVRPSSSSLRSSSSSSLSSSRRSTNTAATGGEAGVVVVSMAACGAASEEAAACPALVGAALQQIVAAGLNTTTGAWTGVSGASAFVTDPCVLSLHSPRRERCSQ